MLRVSPEFDTGTEPTIAAWFEQYYSVRFRNYHASAEYLHAAELISTS